MKHDKGQECLFLSKQTWHLNIMEKEGYDRIKLRRKVEKTLKPKEQEVLSFFMTRYL